MPTQVEQGRREMVGVGGLMNHQQKPSDHRKALKRSPTMNLKRLFTKAMRTASLFKSKKSRPKTPIDIVRHATSLLSYLHSASHHSGQKHSDKVLLFLLRVLLKTSSFFLFILVWVLLI